MCGLAVALALSGWAFGVEEFVLVALSAATLLVWAAASVHCQARRAGRTLVARAELPRQECAVGDDVSVTVRFRNAGRRSLSSLVFEEPELWTVSYPGLLGRGRHRGVVGVAGECSPLRPVPATTARPARWQDPGAIGSDTECALRLKVPTTQRGLWSQPGVRVWCTDPLGLMAMPVGRAPATDLVVVLRPAAGSADPTEPSDPEVGGRRAGGADAEGLVAPGGDEFAGLRPYVPGDRLSRLHWQALARTGDLLVRDFVEPMEGLAEIVVDDRPARVEDSVRQAAALGSALLDGGTGLAVRTLGGERLVVPPGPAARGVLMRALAMVGARP